MTDKRKNSVVRPMAIVLLAVGAAALLATITLAVLENNDIYLYIGGHISSDWMPELFLIFPVSVSIGAVLLLAQRLRTRIIGMVVILPILFVICVILLFTSVDYRCTELISPESDGTQHELVFVETAYFPFGGDGYAYEKIAPGILRKLGDYYADDAARPVFYGHYEIDWRDDGFTLRACGCTTDFSFAD